jgi:hypothetical protein
MINPTCRKSKLDMAKPFSSFWQPNCCPLWNVINERMGQDGQTGILCIEDPAASCRESSTVRNNTNFIYAR